MKKIMTSMLVATVIAGVACSNDTSRPADAMSVDLERDLALVAAAPRTAVVSAIEQQGTTGTPNAAGEGRRAPVRQSPRARPTPAPHHEPAPVEAAPEAVQAPVAATVPAPAAAESPVQTEEAAPPDRSVEATPETVPAPSSGAGNRGSGNTGTGARGTRGGGLGTIGIIMAGVILRGGSAGDDHCEPPGRRRTRTDRNGGIGGVGGMGGMGGVIGSVIGGHVMR